jgi:hypothetical protein
MKSVKLFLRAYVPRIVISGWYTLNRKRNLAELQRCQSPKEMFTTIYKRGHWGRSGDPHDPYFSGLGSRDPEMVGEYIEAVTQFLRSHEGKLNVTDLGCGDFKVGSQLRPHCAGYTACDVVKEVIEWNSRAFDKSGVDFRVLDITEDALPAGDLVFLRQVLQHLSNEDILKVIPKLSNYRYLVITEGLPIARDFIPNIDKPRGPDIRIHLKPNMSGVVITEPPFNLDVKSAAILCEVCAAIGDVPELVRTTLYELRPS